MFGFYVYIFSCQLKLLFNCYFAINTYLDISSVLLCQHKFTLQYDHFVTSVTYYSLKFTRSERNDLLLLG